MGFTWKVPIDHRGEKLLKFENDADANALYAHSTHQGESEKDARPFQNLLNVLPEDYAATESDDVSVQLCFICLLHLANEHNLRIVDCPTMDDLQIFQV